MQLLYMTDMHLDEYCTGMINARIEQSNLEYLASECESEAKDFRDCTVVAALFAPVMGAISAAHIAGAQELVSYRTFAGVAALGATLGFVFISAYFWKRSNQAHSRAEEARTQSSSRQSQNQKNLYKGTNQNVA